MILGFIFIVCNFFCKTHSLYDEILKFYRKTVDRVSLGDPQGVAWFSEPEDRQKLCFYAAVWAKLPWVDFNYVPHWQENLSFTPEKDDYHYGMLCKGLPDLYLFRSITMGEVIQVRLVQSAVDHYEFDISKMPLVKITPRDDLHDKYEDTDFNNMPLDARKDLCALASRKMENHLHFVDGVVGTARPYEFEFADRTITDIAITCPTSPKLFLCRGGVRNTIQLVVLKSGIDEYEFENDDIEVDVVYQASAGKKADIFFDSLTQLNPEDRIKLCTLARQWNGLTTLDTDRDVDEAKIYTFRYSENQKDEHNVTILCPISPCLYLRLVDKNKIKLTFSPLQSSVRVSGHEVVDMVYPKSEKVRTQEDEERLKLHFFTKLDDKSRWRLCHIAQKYILRSENRIHFRFTLAEAAFFPFRLMLTPNSSSMDAPNLRVICTGNQDERFEDIVYKCTRWPEMYIRLGTSKDEIKVILLKEELLLSHM